MGSGRQTLRAMGSTGRLPDRQAALRFSPPEFPFDLLSRFGDITAIGYREPSSSEDVTQAACRGDS